MDGELAAPGILVALNGSALAEQAMPRARVWAERLRVPIHLVTVVDVLRSITPALSPVVAFDTAAYDAAVAHFDAEATAALERVAEQLMGAGLRTTSSVLHGPPFQTIMDTVQDGDLIVMTSHGRGGVRRWLLGSVAEKLVREASVPVILVPVAARHLAASATTPVAGETARR